MVCFGSPVIATLRYANMLGGDKDDGRQGVEDDKLIRDDSIQENAKM